MPGLVLCVCHVDGTILQVSAAWEEVFGCRPKGALADLIHPEDVAALKQQFGPPKSRSARIKRPDGSYQQVVWSAHEPGDGHVYNHFVLAQEDEVEKTLSTLQAIVSNAPVAIAVLDSDGTTRIWNNQARRLFGGELPKEIEKVLSRVLSGDEINDLPVTIKRGETRVDLSVSASTILGSVVLACDDVTDRNAFERQLKQLNRKLEQRVSERTSELQAANQELEAFCFSVSHDIRTPLRAIDGFSRAVIEDYGDVIGDVGRSYLSRVRSASQRLSDLIDSLLRLTRLTRQELARNHVDLGEVAREVALHLQVGAPERSVEFQIAHSLPAYGDPRLLQVMLENLFGNAWKFSSPREHTIIEFGRDEDSFFVRDNGVGFDPAFSSRLFQAFERLHSNAEFPGDGIGLATCHRIVTRHGGSISAVGILGEGVTIRFSLQEMEA